MKAGTLIAGNTIPSRIFTANKCASVAIRNGSFSLIDRNDDESGFINVEYG